MAGQGKKQRALYQLFEEPFITVLVVAMVNSLLAKALHLDESHVWLLLIYWTGLRIIKKLERPPARRMRRTA